MGFIVVELEPTQKNKRQCAIFFSVISHYLYVKLLTKFQKDILIELNFITYIQIMDTTKTLELCQTECVIPNQ